MDKLMADLGAMSSWNIAKCHFGFHKKSLKVYDDPENYTHYHYRLPKDIKVEEGDYVVVMSTSGLGVAIVAEILPNNFENAEKANLSTSWILSCVDLSSHQLRIEAEEKKQYIKTQLEEERRKYEDVQVYRMMAKDNPKVAKMLESLAAIGGEITTVETPDKDADSLEV